MHMLCSTFSLNGPLNLLHRESADSVLSHAGTACDTWFYARVAGGRAQGGDKAKLRREKRAVCSAWDFLPSLLLGCSGFWQVDALSV